MRLNELITRSALRVLFAIAAVLPFTQSEADSPLGVYGKRSSYCGTDEIPQNPATIPQIGCFYLSVDHAVKGTFSVCWLLPGNHRTHYE
jgi:hypothetical protein